jgi:DNA invertase Pin-like site-specific DNA recombinase
LEFNSLDAQREACEAYIKSQAHEGWTASPTRYDDAAFSGGNIDRPAVQQLLSDIDAGQVNVVVVYKIDRLTRSHADFAKLVERFEARNVSFVAVTQQPPPWFAFAKIRSCAEKLLGEIASAFRG